MMEQPDIISPALHQFSLFAVALLLGGGLGIVLDIYRVLRSGWGQKHGLSDFIFWIIITAASLGVIIFFTRGEVYFYTYLGLAAGYLCYYTLFSGTVLRAARYIYCFLNTVCNSLNKLLMKLVRKFNREKQEYNDSV